jgi:predicted ATPase
MPTQPFEWDEDHLKALLQLARAPASLLAEPAAQAWIRAQGGLGAVQAALQTCPLLTERERNLLRVILRHPDQLSDFYANQLSIGRNTYFRYLAQLLPKLVQHLNEGMNPLQAASSATSRMPVPITSYIDSHGAEKAVVNLLHQPQVRLLTLTGPGGVGKTRLALQSAARLIPPFERVAFLSLAAIEERNQLPSQIAYTLKLTQVAGQSLIDVIIAHLQTSKTLLIFDNFEHLLPAATLVSELLQAVPSLSALVTSRQRLHLYGEFEYPVALLSLPPITPVQAPEELMHYAAVRLFVERAQAAQYGFTLNRDNAAEIVQICYHLDGLPLAIELGASQVRKFTTGQILAQLQDRLAFLADGPRDLPTRHRALRNTIEWGYRQLNADEKVVFQRLSVFADSFSVQAARAVCQCDDIESILDGLFGKSLLLGEPSGNAQEASGQRMTMLNTLREYALEQLQASPDADETYSSYIRFYEQQISQTEAEYYNPMAGSVEHQKALMQWFKREHANIQAALKWALNSGQVHRAAHIMGGLWRFWQNLGYYDEAIYWLQRILAQYPPSTAPAYLKLVWAAGWIYRLKSESDFEQARHWFESGLKLAQTAGNTYFICLLSQGLADVESRTNHYAEAASLFRRSLALAEALHNEEEIAWTLIGLGRVLRHLRQTDEARACLERSLHTFQRIGHHLGKMSALGHIGRIALHQGQLTDAQAFLQQAYDLSCNLFDKRTSHAAMLLEGLIYTAMQAQQYDQAAQLMKELFEISKGIRFTGTIYGLECCGWLAARHGDERTAVQFYAGAHAFYVGETSGYLQGSMFWELRPQQEAERDAMLQQLRQQLPTHSYQSAWQEGHARDLRDILQQAIHWLQTVR